MNFISSNLFCTKNISMKRNSHPSTLDLFQFKRISYVFLSLSILLHNFVCMQLLSVATVTKPWQHFVSCLRISPSTSSLTIEVATTLVLLVIYWLCNWSLGFFGWNNTFCTKITIDQFFFVLWMTFKRTQFALKLLFLLRVNIYVSF